MIYTISRHYNTEERVANGIEMPERAEIALMQEEKFKTFYSQLNLALAVIPVTAMILRPHFKDMEWKLRPGMTTRTLLNIDPYINHVHSGLKKLQELVICINDIIKNRVEKNLKIASKTLLVDFLRIRRSQCLTLSSCSITHSRTVTTLAGQKHGD